MGERSKDQASRRMLVIMPRLLGECVMATAVLGAIRRRYPETHVTVLIKRKLRPVVWGLDCVDRVLSVRKRLRKRGKSRRRAALFRLARRLSAGGFDTAVIFPNAFKAAALPTLAGIPRRVGYECEGRGVLLTDRLVPRRHRGKPVHMPTLERYLAFARYLGADEPDPPMQQRIKPEADARLTALLDEHGVASPDAELLLINPGAPAQMRRWSPRRMGHLCELLTEHYKLTPVVTGTPAERPVVEQLLERAEVPILDLPALGTDLHLLKAMVGRSRMMVTNDTGPRHLALAMDVPVLTLFGPTHPTGAGMQYDHEAQVVADGLSVAARDDPSFTGQASLDRLHTDEVFDRACSLYEHTRGLRAGVAR